MIVIRQFDADVEATDFANEYDRKGYTLISVACSTILRYDRERKRDVAEHCIVVTMQLFSIAEKQAQALRLAA